MSCNKLRLHFVAVDVVPMEFVRVVRNASSFCECLSHFFVALCEDAYTFCAWKSVFPFSMQ